MAPRLCARVAALAMFPTPLRVMMGRDADDRSKRSPSSTQERHRTLSGRFRLEAAGEQLWRVTAPDWPGLLAYLRHVRSAALGPETAQAEEFTVFDRLAIDWNAESGPQVRFHRGDRTLTMAASAVTLHEPIEGLYEALPLATFDRRMRRFWWRVFHIVRWPGGRWLLSFDRAPAARDIISGQSATFVNDPIRGFPHILAYGPCLRPKGMTEMSDSKPCANTESTAAEASFDSYARLIKVLMPNLQGVAVHNRVPLRIWASADWDVADQEAIAEEAIAQASADSSDYPAVMCTLDSGHALYAFAVRGERIELLGVVTIAVTLSGARSEARPLEYVRKLVQPALECLRRELSLRSELGSRERDLGVRERDFALMLEISSDKATGGDDADEFEQILKTAMDHTGCALAALWVPDKNISKCSTRSGQPMAPGVLKLAEQHLLAWMQLQQRTIVVNRIAQVTTQDAAPYKILACPVRHRSERVMGVLALFNPPSAADFDAHKALRRRTAREARDRRHTGALRSGHGSDDAPGARAPGPSSARLGRRFGCAQHSISRHRPAACHQRNLRHACRR